MGRNYILGNSAGDLFGMVSFRDPFKWLSDLQLGDQTVTLNHLVYFVLSYSDFNFAEMWKRQRFFLQ